MNRTYTITLALLSLGVAAVTIASPPQVWGKAVPFRHFVLLCSAAWSAMLCGYLWTEDSTWLRAALVVTVILVPFVLAEYLIGL